MGSNEYHIPVMLDEALEWLAIKPEGTYVDATFGGGGHSSGILRKLGPTGRLIAFDQDADAEANAIDDPRFELIRANFAHMRAWLRMRGAAQVDGILADLGVSSHQFDTAGRGFSTRMDGELDMRMDRRGALTAATVVNTYSEEALAGLLRSYGELPNARQMARSIAQARAESAIGTTMQLRQAVDRHLPRGMENKYLAMLFQALRIEVNGELKALEEMLGGAMASLAVGGRLVVISYHSLEDRMVKTFMKCGDMTGEEKKDFYGNSLAPLRPMGKRRATAEEVAANSRARSAMLRVAEKVRDVE